MGFWNSAGEWFEGLGKHIGASIDMARAYASGGVAGAAVAAPGAYMSLAPAETKAIEQAGKAANQALGWYERNVASPVTDYTETNTRFYYDMIRRGDVGQVLDRGADLLSGGPVNAVPLLTQTALDPEYQEYWQRERATDSSVMQAVWEIGRSHTGDGSNSQAYWDPETRQLVAPLLDDPAMDDERQEFFSQGARKWVTGVGDAIITVASDPINVLDPLAGAAKAAATQVTKQGITAASKTGRGAALAAERGAAGTAEVEIGVLARQRAADDLATAAAGVADDVAPAPAGTTPGAPLVDDTGRAYLRSKLGDDMQSMFTQLDAALTRGGAREAAELLSEKGIPDVGDVMDAARYEKGTNDLLSAEDILSAAGDKMRDTDGVTALFEKGADVDVPWWTSELGEVTDPAKYRLGWADKRFRSNVEKLTDHVWESRGRAGLVSGLAQDSLLRQSSDAGAVADALGWIAETVADERIAKGVMDDFIYAAAGDGGALSRIGEFSKRMQIDVEALVQPDRIDLAKSIMTSPRFTWDEKIAIVNSDELLERAAKEIGDDLQKMGDKFARFEQAAARTRSAGTLGGVAPKGLADLGDIRTVPFTGAFHTVGSFQPYRHLPPISFLAGKHVPGFLNLADSEAPGIFQKWVDKSAQRVIGKDGSVEDAALVASLKDDFAAAADPAVAVGSSRANRQNAVTRLNAVFENRLARKYAEKHGKGDPDLVEDLVKEVKEWIAEAKSFRNAEFQGLMQKAKSSVQEGQPGVAYLADGFPVAFTGDAAKTLSTAQFAQTAHLVDWRRMDDWLASRYRPGLIDDAPEQVMKAATGADRGGRVLGAARAMGKVQEEVINAWKLSALFRVAYPMRVQVDSQLRNFATMGAFQYTGFLLNVPKNAIMNRFGRVETSFVAMVEKKRQAVKEVWSLEEQIAASKGGKRKKSLQERRDAAQQILDMSYDDWMASGLWKGEDGKVRLGATSLKRIQGSGEKFTKKGEYDVDRFAPYVFGVEDMKSILNADAKDSVMGLFRDSQEALQKEMRRKRDFQYVQYGTDRLTKKAWNEGYMQAVNNHMRNDAMFMRMAAGQNDAQIAEWLTKTPEGRQHFADINQSGAWDSADDFLEHARSHFMNLVPDREAMDLVLARDITENDIARWYARTGRNRPHVPTQVYDTMREEQSQISALYQGVRDWWFKNAASLPETYMARHPQYQSSYKARMRELMSATGKDMFTSKDIRELRKRADRRAREDMKRVVFDTGYKSEVGHVLRNLSPFYSAWEDTMVKWGRIAADRPSSAYNALVRPFESATSTGQVFDEDGNQITHDGRVVDRATGETIRHTSNINEGFIYFTLPEGVPVAGGQEFKLSRGSLNSVMQGDDWWFPGVGPIQQIGVNEVVTNVFPELGDNPVVGLIQPYGQTEEAPPAQMVPSHFRNMWSAIAAHGQERFWSTDTVDTFNMLMQDELTRQRMTGVALSESETYDKVKKGTRNFMIMKWLGTSSSPGSTTPVSEFEFYRQEFRRYTDAEEDYSVALRKFNEDYPEFSAMTVHFTENETGVAPTEEGFMEARKWGESLLTQHPLAGPILAGPDQYDGEFSDAVYTRERRIGWRKDRAPQDAFDSINVERGWTKWNQVTTMIDEELDRRGLSSIAAQGAEDLVLAKKQALDGMVAENPAWGEEYMAGGQGANRATMVLSDLRQAMEARPELAEERADLRTFQTYMEAREMTRQALRMYGVSSIPTEAELAENLASGTGDATRNYLAMAWYQAVAQMKNDNPLFAKAYASNGMERDNLVYTIGGGVDE